jgi:trimethylamine---corrinoid protein Co-methyltransferase
MFKFAEVITSEQIERVHEASLEILENIGILVRNQKARQVFARHGCLIETGSELVKFPRAVVEEFRAVFPPPLLFAGGTPVLTARSRVIAHW